MSKLHASRQKSHRDDKRDQSRAHGKPATQARDKQRHLLSVYSKRGKRSGLRASHETLTRIEEDSTCDSGESLEPKACITASTCRSRDNSAAVLRMHRPL